MKNLNFYIFLFQPFALPAVKMVAPVLVPTPVPVLPVLAAVIVNTMSMNVKKRNPVIRHVLIQSAPITVNVVKALLYRQINKVVKNLVNINYN